jgi:hypothetical protein
MRTTIRIDDYLLAEAKKRAAARRTTLTAVIEDSLRESFARNKPQRRRRKFHLPTFKGNGLQPGVDLDNSAAVLDLMDDRQGID